MKINRLISLLLVGTSFALIVSCSNPPTTKTVAEKTLNLLIEGQFDKVYNQYSSEQWRHSTSLQEFIQGWEEKITSSGEFVAIHSLTTAARGEKYTVAEANIEYSKVIVPVRMIFNQEQELISITLTNGIANAVLSEDLKEEEIVIGQGTAYELGGTLTLPKNAPNKLSAVVLVHGSGPSDRDESAFAYKPFRDIAWGLAQHGIAVLRYDKRTFIYGNYLSKEETKQFTVHEETIEDALQATEVLKADTRIDANKVFLLGHSLGGMLAPRIEAEAGDFAGIIILAGSPRSLWEIIYDQNMNLLNSEEMDQTMKTKQVKLIKQEYEKAKQLQTMTDQEAQNETVFGLPAYYFKEMDRYHTKKLVTQLEKPMLILQGEDDFQVSYEKDFAMYRDILADKNNVEFISYPNLNHFFIEYEGKDKGTIAEYDYPKIVESYVINDIGHWILKISK